MLTMSISSGVRSAEVMEGLHQHTDAREKALELVAAKRVARSSGLWTMTW
ncbi:hypothetical protein TPAR_05502 [Tolypocladium paradoxum]|uniref:Uncharacterized protein n=1 Tax=Tolypocladium paradoxum TaxID=94208 RepID=A0A2S4KVS7_9HYPO|nr:hypothetical protein TPAR_05502 [Tolypocladium paradoxum]